MKHLIWIIAVVLVPLELQAQINRDSLWGVWNNIEEADSNKLMAIKDLIQKGYLFSNPDTAFHIAQSMYEFAEAGGYSKWKETARNYQGISLAIRGNNKEAIKYFSQCLEINEKLNNQHRIAGSLNNIGNLYTEIEDYDKALHYLSRAYKKYESIADTNGLALSLGNISMIQIKTGNLDSSLISAQKSLEFFQATDDLKGVANSYSSLGTSHGSLGDRAKEQGREATKHYKQALSYYQKALPLRERAGDKDGVAVTKHGMGMIYNQLGDQNKAIELISESLRMAEEINSPSSIQNATGELSSLYKSKGMYKKAYDMFAYYHEISDSLLSEENKRSVIRQEFDYAYQKKALADSIAESERTIKRDLMHQNELLKKDRGRNLMISLALFALLFALGLWSRMRYIKSANLKLAEAKERAEQSEKYKEQFLANMSHEIRTPMHAISGMLKILNRNDHPTSQDIYLNAMHTSSDNLVVILNDVLDLSKIEAGKLEIESIPISLHSIVDNVTQVLRFKAEEKGLELKYTIDDTVPAMVMGDPTRLNQILLNLAGNAIKFTEKGSVNIHLSRSDDKYKFSIRDTGIGIAKNKLDTIFGAFEQSKDSTSRLYGGTGLGLSISKQLVELQNGKIWVQSELGKGSNFFVELPLMLAEKDAMSEDLITEDKLALMAASLKGLRILLAEDNPFNQMIAQDDLAYYIEDLNIDIVDNGARAVEYFEKESYDLILMDVQMPEMNGFEATRKIREFESEQAIGKRIPIIAMTASLLKSEIKNCYEAGMDNYIPKPYKPEELIGPIYKEFNEKIRSL